jgi:DNA-binding NtrC family response regulator
MKNKIRILHIDDNLHDRQLVKFALQKDNDEFEIIEADSRQEFEQLLSENEFDLVLSDFNILGFDGFQVLNMVKERSSDTPVIIITGTGSEEIAVQAMKLGADDYVLKSVKHIQNLVPTIRKVLENKRIQREHNATLIALQESE